MDYEMGGLPAGEALYSLIPLEEFKLLLPVDSREDLLSSFVLLISTYGIEQYCRRRFLVKNYTDYADYTGDGLIALKEYPVREVHCVQYSREWDFSLTSVLTPDLYGLLPELDESPMDLPYYLTLKNPCRYVPGCLCLKVRYRAGYQAGDVPPDLKSACLELAAWNMARYRGRRIGMTGNVKGEGLELSIPEQVRQILEPYRRRMI
jgi:hypothetical protein